MTETYTFRVNGSDISGDRLTKWSSSRNAAVLNSGGQIVAWYERSKSYRSTSVDASWRDPETGSWHRMTKASQGDHPTLRAAWAAKVSEVFGVEAR